MNFLSKLKHLASHILFWFAFLLILTIFFLSFGLKPFTLAEKTVFIPLPTTTHSFSALVFEKIKADLVPETVELVVLSPLTAFVAQIKVAFFLAFLTLFPFLLYSLAAYIRPALFAREKNILFMLLFSSTALFLSGCAFAYFIVIPSMFAALYRFADAIEAVSFFAVNELTTLVFAFMFTTGILFLLPVCMYLLSSHGFVEKEFWKRNWGYAFLTFLVITAIITPDGSGVSMTLLTVPLIALYGLGTVISSKL